MLGLNAYKDILVTPAKLRVLEAFFPSVHVQNLVLLQRNVGPGH